MRWSESPLWQSFSGEVYFEHRRPCDGSLLTRFRRILGEEGVEELLAQTVNVAVDMKVIDPRELESVIKEVWGIAFMRFCVRQVNIRWLMGMILKHGIRRFLRLIFAGMVRANEGYFPRNLFWNLSWT